MQMVVYESQVYVMVFQQPVDLIGLVGLDMQVHDLILVIKHIPVQVK